MYKAKYDIDSIAGEKYESLVSVCLVLELCCRVTLM